MELEQSVLLPVLEEGGDILSLFTPALVNRVMERIRFE